MRPRSSVAEHSLGKGEVDSSILSAGTKFQCGPQPAFVSPKGFSARAQPSFLASLAQWQSGFRVHLEKGRWFDSTMRRHFRSFYANPPPSRSPSC
jgi:hypothetical protein